MRGVVSLPKLLRITSSAESAPAAVVISVIWEPVSIGSSTPDDASRARCSMPLLHIHYLNYCGNLPQDPASYSSLSL